MGMAIQDLDTGREVAGSGLKAVSGGATPIPQPPPKHWLDYRPKLRRFARNRPGLSVFKL